MIKRTVDSDYRRALAAAPLLLPALLLSHTEFELWYAATLFVGMIAALSFQRRTEREAFRRVKTGLCPDCGYDLRASPHYCPECGTPVRPPEPA